MPILRIPYGVLDGRYVNTSGDSMLGPLTLPGLPTLDSHAATKKYVDDADANFLKKDGSVALTADWDIGDSRRIKASEIKARDSNGLRLLDNAGNGVLIKSGTLQGVTRPAATLVVAASDSNAAGLAQADYVCDGTDDQVQINAAINALATTSSTDINILNSVSIKQQGGTVLLLEGTYVISDAISLTGKQMVELKGQGVNTVIKNTSTDGSHAVEADNPTAASPGLNFIGINNLTVIGNASSGSGIYLKNVNFPLVRDCWLIDNGGYGIELISADSVWGQEDKIIDRCTIINNDDGGIHLNLVHETLISDCHIEENGAYGIVTDSGTFNTIITGCSIEDHTTAELYLKSVASLITGNIIEGLIHLDNYWGQLCKDIVISGNVIDGTILGQRRDGSSWSVGLAITGNIFSFHTIQVIKLSYWKNVVISGNKFKSDRVATPFRGMYLEHIEDLDISGNIIKSYSPSIYIGGASTGDVIISNNNITSTVTGSPDAAYGIQLEALPATSEVRIEGNLLKKDGAADMTDGIRVNISGRAVIKNNTIENATNKINPVAGTVVAAQNIGYLTENAGTATVASGNTYVDVSHGLAITPSINNIHVSPTNNLGNAAKFWVSNVGASTFRINVDTDPGATTATFVWQIGSY